MTTIKIIGLALLYILAALLIALILYLASLIAARMDEVSKSDGYNIRVRTGTYGEAR